MSVPMAIADYIPVVLFFLSVMVLQRYFYERMTRNMFALFSAGSVMVFMAGALKATWKLLYAMNICDFEKLNSMFFPVQSIGFILLGISVLLTAIFRAHPKKRKVMSVAVVPAAAPAVFSGTVVFIILMVLGLAGFAGGLVIESSRKKKHAASLLFVLAFLMLLIMGYLATKDFSKAWMNWLAEVVNACGQICLFFGSCILADARRREIKAMKEAEKAAAIEAVHEAEFKAHEHEKSKK